MVRKGLATVCTVVLLLVVGLASFTVQGATSTTTLYDANVSLSVTLRPGTTLNRADVNSAIQADAAANGVADRYVISITGTANKNDYVYPILMGANGTEAWPSGRYAFSYRVSASRQTVYGSILGSEFTSRGDTPSYIYLYAESQNTTFTISHVKVEAIRTTAATTTTKATTTTTKATTTTTTTAPTTAASSGATRAVIFDSAVSGSLALRPSATFTNSAIEQALAAENAAYGVADRYLITVQASASPTDYIYPILMGGTRGEAWPSNNYEHNYRIGANGTIYGVLPGSAFTTVGDTPASLLFYAESGNASLTVTRVKIEVVRKGGQTPTTQSTTKATTTRTTTTTTKATTTSTTRSTTRSTTSTTQTTQAGATNAVIFDAVVSGSLSLRPSAVFANSAIAQALAAENAAYGVADRYLITVQASASPTDYIYPILSGASGAEAWPSNSYDHNYYIGAGGTIYGVLPGAAFANVGDTPANLLFYAEGGNASLTVTRVKIEVVRRGGQAQPTASTTRTTSTKATTAPTAAPVNDGHPHFTYNTSTNYGSLGVWWWNNNTAIDANAREVRLNFLQSNHVTEIYLWANGMSNAQIATFIRAAASRGMRVAWLSGDVAWLENGGFDAYYNQYNAYQAQAASDAKFYAMHLDVEPHQWGNTPAIWQEYANLVVRAGNKAHGAGHKIEWDIPYWLEGKTATVNGSSGALLNVLATYADTLCLMSYRDTAAGILSAGNEEYGLGSAYNCKIVLGVETYSEEGNFVSFMEEGKGAMYNALTAVMNSLAGKSTLGAGYGCAIHQIEVWMDLRD